MTAIIDTLGLLSRIAAFTMFLVVLADLIHAGRYNGPVMASLRHVWISVAIVLVFPLIGTIERITNFLPDCNLYAVAMDWIWIPYGILCTALVRLRTVLHSAEARRWLKSKDIH